MLSESDYSGGSIPAASTTESGDISLKAKGFASRQSDTENAQNCPKLPPLSHDLGTVSPPAPPSTPGEQVAISEWRLRYRATKTYEHLPWCGQNKWQPHDEDCYCIRPRYNDIGGGTPV